MTAVRAHAPGRVNLIGDHTDYMGGYVLPVAIDLGTTIVGSRGGSSVELRSDHSDAPAIVPLIVDEPARVEPEWARYVAGVVAELRPSAGFDGDISTSLPIGAGLSSSAALEVAVALALGAPPYDALAVALMCQRAEQRASGVPCGLMDQLASAAGIAQHALLIDCRALTFEPVLIPDGLEILVAHSGEPRALASSAYAERRAQCEAAEALIGPLRDAAPGDESSIDDPVIRRRARHVLTENARVLDTVAAFRTGDTAALGDLMAASHASLRDDFDVSTPALDQVVEHLSSSPGVHGARLTGAGFGGCALALADEGTSVDIPGQLWRVRASAGATCEVLEALP